MSIPTLGEILAEYERQFPRARLSGTEQHALVDILKARHAGVGYGWMRQALGIIWKLDDPRGYIDDDRIIELHAPKRRARKRKR